jgi:hypothetical protein
MKSGVRWTANRKNAVLARIAKGTLSEADAWKLYGISPEELQEWRDVGVFASKTQKAIRRTKPRPRKPNEKLPTLRDVPPEPTLEAADD